MKKFLVAGLAALMLLGLTACSKTCASCGEKVGDEAVEVDGKYYCHDNLKCLLEAGIDSID